ncbi:putative O-methyltransferase [Mollisia scopiformis]|uniref:Putative O-methyltransferase n=1 Tax=Mollisia scopiformis TaxID=149040 RepID=A0A132B8X2_MOLSC|nr:putative O-methyltransferase [Mollisia scopiformis]KUJ08860.1 putative O-methyltransferase [Mollisia scopiformis]
MASLLQRIAAAGKTYEGNEAGSREDLINLSRARSFWAESAMSAHIRLAVDVQLFQHLRDFGDIGLSAQTLAEKTGLDVLLLGRLIETSSFHATALSNGLSEEIYQHSISFGYDAARPSFNAFPEYFKKIGYKQPTSLTDGPFQDAHRTQLPFFDWLVATPPNLQHFGSFMAAYRAGKANWYDPGFYPVADRLIHGFDSSMSDILLVDVGGGEGHDMTLFAAQHTFHPGRIVLQDREPVIASVVETLKADSPFEAQAHDFFTTQPIKGARAYSLHSILHDWGDDDGVRILENLKPALRPGYSRVLLNEIVLSEENPTLAAASMDMMMLAHFAVRERTEADWKAILERVGLKFVKIYTYPGVAESVIEAELAS